jgi:hypothetical protein
MVRYYPWPTPCVGGGAPLQLKTKKKSLSILFYFSKTIPFFFFYILFLKFLVFFKMVFFFDKNCVVCFTRIFKKIQC